MLPGMALPDGFHWIRSSPSQAGEDVLAYEFRWVAQLYQRVDNLKWFARLDVQLEAEGRKRAPRPCQSYWTGRAGIEQWAARHEARLRAEVLAIKAAAAAGKVGGA